MKPFLFFVLIAVVLIAVVLVAPAFAGGGQAIVVQRVRATPFRPFVGPVVRQRIVHGHAQQFVQPYYAQQFVQPIYAQQFVAPQAYYVPQQQFVQPYVQQFNAGCQQQQYVSPQLQLNNGCGQFFSR